MSISFEKMAQGWNQSKRDLFGFQQFLNPLRLTFNTVALVSHNSILSTYMTGLLNLPFQEGKDLFAKLGATYVLGYDWERGDQNWTVKKTIAGV